MPGLTVGEIASLLNTVAEGDADRLITGAAALADASECDLSFAAGKSGLAAAGASKAGCLIVSQDFAQQNFAQQDFAQQGRRALIRVSEPRSAFARVLNSLYPPKQRASGVHPTAVIGSNTQIAVDCYVGAHVTLGNHAVVGSGCVIENGCVIGDGVTLGPGTLMHANVTIYDGVTIGARVIVHSGAVIGADGFGFAFIDGRYQKFPQVGTVVIEDDVEIGAGCCIDRAALGKTRIGAGTKLDNLVHVAHNCVLGRNVVVAAQTGFSGSVTVGDSAVIGGQAGIGEKARIEAGAVIGGKAGILTSATVHAGEPVWGIPARPLRQHLRGLAHVSKLPEIREEVRRMRRQLDQLDASAERSGSAERGTQD